LRNALTRLALLADLSREERARYMSVVTIPVTVNTL
jgi:hypothetical protein